MAIYEDEAIKEIPIYGSSRLGQYRPKTATKPTALGQRIYEFSNHLGNVLVTLSDNKVPQTDGTYSSVVLSASDYYPFGMIMSGRSYQNTAYRFGFQGQEYDEETGTDHYTYRQADRITGRFWSVDPLAPSYPHNSPYVFSENRVIDGVELEGAEYESINDESYKKLRLDLQAKLKQKNYIGVLQQIVDHYNFDIISDANSYYFEVDEKMNYGEYVTDQPNSYDDIARIRIASITMLYDINDIDPSFLAGTILGVYHEIIHVKQRREGMTNKNEREFLAHYYTLFQNKAEEDFGIQLDNNISNYVKKQDPSREVWIQKSRQYYANLSPIMQEQYVQKMAEINILAEDKEFTPLPLDQQIGPVKSNGSFY